jgi:hypothetical protein
MQKQNISKKIGLIALALLFTFSLFQCTSNKARTSAKQKVVEPFEKVKIEADTYKIVAEKGGEIKLDNGTKITVPANAFVDSEGKPVSGEVDIKYREFHSAVDIMVSGIPMKMVDNGKEYDFESAGMFEIKGYSGENEIAIAKDKAINVQMASFKKEENYNHYYFDEEKGEWKELAKAVKPEKNEDITKTPPQAAVASIGESDVVSQAEIIPIAPKKYNPKTTVLNLNVDYDKYPYLKEFNGVVWQYAGTDPANDPKNNAWLTNTTWSSVSLELKDVEKSLFTLNVKAGSNEYTALVTPVLKGKAFDKALKKYETNLAAYNKKQKEAEKVYQQQNRIMQQQADIVRAFSVNNFGIYNCDRYRGTEGLFALNWDVVFESGMDNRNITIYHVCKTDNTLIQFWGGKSQFLYDPDKENVLLAVLPDNKVAYFGKEDFERIKLSNVSSGRGYTFNFKNLDAELNNVDDVEALVAGI